LTTQPDTNSVFLVSGGGKGITAQCVIKLAERFGSTFILLGRSSIAEPEPAWAAGCDDEAALKRAAIRAAQTAGRRMTPVQIRRAVRAVLSRREIEGTLDAVARAGGTARYLSVDVTDGDALNAALDGIRERVTGIIHGAGVLADKLIENKTGADFEKVYAVKVGGLQNLLARVPPGQLQHLILFSSVAGFYGNVGQADYALANEILNKMAHLVRRDHPACHVLAIDWGPWDGGMVTPALKRMLAKRGIDVIPIEVGTSLLADELANGAGRAPQIVVGGPMVAPAPEPDAELRAYHIHRRLTLAANPFLRDHVIGGRAVLPTVCAVAWMVNACEQCYPGYTFFSVDDYRALKGIVFDASLAADYVLELKEAVKTRDELVFEALIRSQTADGKPRFHYSARVTLRRALPAAPVFTAFDLREREPVSGSALYAANTRFHGPSFRGVDRVLNIGPQGLTMRCVPPRVPIETQGQFPVQTFNPYLTDVQLQSLLIWAKHFKQVGGLPLRIRRGEQFRVAHFGETMYATLEVTSSTERSLVADVIVHDAEGLVYSHVTGAEITLSARLNTLFRENRL
jgi:NAD(P)-dependent dehydrogenase (short-subunit alcohol dehydrogenase family)